MFCVNELKNRHLALYPLDGIDKNKLVAVENALSIKLPNDFCEIAQFYSGGMLGDVSIYSFNIEDVDNIVGKTEFLRKTINLPNDFILLSEPDESIIVMNVKDSNIFWIDATDAENLQSGSFESSPDTWETFADFFAELLTQEENDNAG